MPSLSAGILHCLSSFDGDAGKKSRGPKNVIRTPDTSVSVVIPVHP